MRAILPKLLMAGALLSASDPGQAFTRFSTIADWLCAGDSERATIVSTLTLVAGQGIAEHNEDFFARCIDEVSLNAHDLERTLSEVATGCTFVSRTTFADVD